MKRLLCLFAIGALPALAWAADASANRGLWPAEPAGQFMMSVVREKVAGDYARAWQSLYPPHQRIAPLAAYVGCESLVPSPGTLVGLKVLRSRRERIRVAGRARKLTTRAVTVRVRVASLLYPFFPVVDVEKFHAVPVQRHWRWILSAYQFEYYSAGTCPYS